MFNLCEPFGAGNVVSDLVFDFGREHGGRVSGRRSETPFLWEPQIMKSGLSGGAFKTKSARRVVWNSNCDPYTSQVYQGEHNTSWGWNNFAPEMYYELEPTRHWYRIWGMHFGVHYKYKALELLVTECERLFALGEDKWLHGPDSVSIVEMDSVSILQRVAKDCALSGKC